jgi:hypothetical protein
MYVPAAAKSHKKRPAKSERASSLSSYVRHVWVLDYIYIPVSAIAGEPKGPMRQYVPIIFPLVLFRSLARLIARGSSSSHRPGGRDPRSLLNRPRAVHARCTPDESFGFARARARDYARAYVRARAAARPHDGDYVAGSRSPSERYYSCGTLYF